MSAIKIQNLVKTYANGTQALKGINLDVEPGDFFSLLGANGAGKTTVIGILTGLVIKTAGEASVFGYDVVDQAYQARFQMGVVPQEMNFNIFEKAIDVVVTQAGYFGIDRWTAQKYAEELFQKLDLWNHRNMSTKMLSGGMKRRLMIARALINKPKLLILDEPTAGIDVELRHVMWGFLKELNRSGTTILLTTHYLEEVEQLCQNAAIIKNGEIIKNDSVKNLMGLVESETYVVHVDAVKNLEQMSHYKPMLIDEQTFEVLVNKKQNMNDLVMKLAQAGMVLVDLRTKGSRIENLFLQILKK